MTIALFIAGMAVAAVVGYLIRYTMVEPNPPSRPYEDRPSIVTCGVDHRKLEYDAAIRADSDAAKAVVDLAFRVQLRSCLEKTDVLVGELRTELETHRRPGTQKALLDGIEKVLDDFAILMKEDKNPGGDLGELPGRIN